MNRLISIFFFFALPLGAAAPLSLDSIQEWIRTGITVDLRDPLYTQGSLSTEKGGVITAPGVRIQAQKIVYTKHVEDGNAPICLVEAEGDVVLQFKEYIFVGNALSFDFLTSTGKILNGRTTIEPWIFGGETIYLFADGSYEILNGFITTSTEDCPEWRLQTDYAHLSPCQDLLAKRVHFKVFDTTLLWVPTLRINLDSIFDSPIRYSFKWGGRQGPRIGFTYEFLDWNNWKAFARFDYRITRGPGGGIETRYRSDDRTVRLDTINYIARDSSLLDSHERTRYRFQGTYINEAIADNLSVSASWDKVSDIEMATDYNDRGLELDTAGRTELHMRHLTDARISNFWSRVRVNNFETIKQELPSVQTTWHPLTLGDSGVIFENRAKAGYLDFKYTKGLPNVHSYHSTRFEYMGRFFRPFNGGVFRLTPELGGAAIFYGNTPKNGRNWLVFGDVGFNLNTRLTGSYRGYKHVIIPYAEYRYLTSPTSSPAEHYIFDLDDGWYRLNQLRFGIKQNFYTKNLCGATKRAVAFDLYSFAFFDTPTFHKSIPKVYGDVTLFLREDVRTIFETAWDMQRGLLDHFNVRTEWTLSEDVALSAEYRHRDAYDWRKADHHNFILDSYSPVKQLKHSALSDRRDTFLLHLFYRFHPFWALQLESRSGWNRKHQPNYNEFEVDLLGRLPSAWNIKMSYQHKEEDDRVAIYVSIGKMRPNKPCPVPCFFD